MVDIDLPNERAAALTNVNANINPDSAPPPRMTVALHQCSPWSRAPADQAQTNVPLRPHISPRPPDRSSEVKERCEGGGGGGGSLPRAPASLLLWSELPSAVRCCAAERKVVVVIQVRIARGLPQKSTFSPVPRGGCGAPGRAPGRGRPHRREETTRNQQVYCVAPGGQAGRRAPGG